MKFSTSPYRITPLWSEDDWEYMNDSIEVGIYFQAYPAWVDEQVKVRKPVHSVLKAHPTEEQKKEASQARRQIVLEVKENLKYDTEEDVTWFWIHLSKMLLPINITLDQIDAEQYYASNTDGQVCRVVKDTNDTKHPADAAKTTAQKIVLFFAQQKLTEVNDEK